MSEINDQQIDYIATGICFDLIMRNGDVCYGSFGEYCQSCSIGNMYME